MVPTLTNEAVRVSLTQDPLCSHICISCSATDYLIRGLIPNPAHTPLRQHRDMAYPCVYWDVSDGATSPRCPLRCLLLTWNSKFVCSRNFWFMISANLLIALRKTLEEERRSSGHLSPQSQATLPSPKDPSESAPKTQGRERSADPLTICSHCRPGVTFAWQELKDHLFDFR